jgi:hypothetical protein
LVLRLLGIRVWAETKDAGVQRDASPNGGRAASRGKTQDAGGPPSVT